MPISIQNIVCVPTSNANGEPSPACGCDQGVAVVTEDDRCPARTKQRAHDAMTEGATFSSCNTTQNSGCTPGAFKLVFLACESPHGCACGTCSRHPAWVLPSQHPTTVADNLPTRRQDSSSRDAQAHVQLGTPGLQVLPSLPSDRHGTDELVVGHIEGAEQQRHQQPGKVHH